MKLKTRLAISVTALLVIPSLAVGLFSYNASTSSISREATLTTQQEVSLVNSYIDALVVPEKMNVEELSNLLPAANTPQVGQSLKDFGNTHTEDETTSIGTDKGEFIQYPYSTMPKGYDPRTRSWYTDAIKNKGNVVISAPYISKSTGNVVVTISKTTADGHGVFAVSMNMQKLQDKLKSLKIGSNGYVFVLDNTGRYVYYPSHNPGEMDTTAKVKTMLGESFGSLDDSNNGKPQHIEFETNSTTAWKIAGSSLVSDIKVETNPILYNLIVVLVIALIVGAIAILFLIRSFLNPIKVLKDISARIASGDLTDHNITFKKDEIGELAFDFKKMKDSLQTVIGEFKQATEQVAASSEELNASAEQTSRATEYIATSMQELAAGSDKQAIDADEGSKMVSDVYTSVRHVSENIERVSASVEQTNVYTDKGNQAILNATVNMNTINEKVTQTAAIVKKLADDTRNIGQIVEVITGIASQTNLLALNAAIEAARAGEHGRGFAVVADEVRKLAEQSAHSATQIGELIQTIQVETEKATVAMDESIQTVEMGKSVVHTAETSFEEIERSIKIVTVQIEEITEDIKSINRATEGVVNKIVSIDQITQQGASNIQNVSASAQEQLASMEEITASSNALAQLAEELQNVVSKFQV